MYRISFKKKAEKELRKAPTSVLIRLVTAIDNLEQNPRLTVVKR